MIDYSDDFNENHKAVEELIEHLSGSSGAAHCILSWLYAVCYRACREDEFSKMLRAMVVNNIKGAYFVSIYRKCNTVKELEEHLLSLPDGEN